MSDKDTIKMCLIEDDADVIKAVQSVFEESAEVDLHVEHVRQLGDMTGLPDRVVKGAYHVLLVDLGLPGHYQLGRRWQAGLDLLSEIEKRQCRAVPVVLTAHDQEENYVETARRGAQTLIAKKGAETWRVLPVYVRAAFAFWLARENQRRNELVGLAGQLAHDLGNVFGVLGPTFENAFNRQEDLTGTPEGHDALGRCVRLVYDMGGHFRMMAQILQGESREDHVFEDVDLAQVAGDIKFLWESKLPSWRVEMDVNVSGTPSAQCCRVWVFTCLLNLCKNALESMAHTGGRLIVRVTDDNDSPDYVVIIVADTGCGMTPEQLRQFLGGTLPTTKDLGLGLGIRSIARCLEIHKSPPLEAESKVGSGTVVRIRLPRRHV